MKPTQGGEGALDESSIDRISVILNATGYKIIKDEDGLDTIQMEGFSSILSPGDPMLPRKVYNILVPPDTIGSSLQLKIVSAETRVLEGTYDIKPAGPFVPGVEEFSDEHMGIECWGEGKNIVDGKNLNVYGNDANYPENYVELLPYSQMRKWKFARVDFVPFQYNPVSKKLTLIESAVIEISYNLSPIELDDTLVADTIMDDIAPLIFINYDQAKDWYEQKIDMKPLATYDYVIITTNLIEANSAKLSSFIAHKQNRGYNVLVVTEDEFGGLTGQAPSHRAEKIRQWLINNYASMGIKYVLLIGNPSPYESGEGDIPMKMCWPYIGEPHGYEDSPTDYFYADLTGDWDKDGDQLYGEWGDYYPVAGGVDLTPEVYVGRIPVYGADYTTLDNILQKTIDYETASGIGWRKSILMPMGFQSPNGPYDGAPLGEQMKNDYLDFEGYDSWRMYQQGNGACWLTSIYPSEEELRGGTVVRDRWAADDYGIVCWWGHGSPTHTSVGYDYCWDGTLFWSDYCSSLDDGHPAFTYQCSCSNGRPEYSDNLGYAILRQGGIGTVAATRVSWYTTSQSYGEFDGSPTNAGLGYEYVKRLVQGLPAGDALYQAKMGVSPSHPAWLTNWYGFNLYGDPEVSLEDVPLLKIKSGSTTPGATDWMQYSDDTIYVDVDTSSAGFIMTPVYITSLGGLEYHRDAEGSTAIYDATPTGFRIYLTMSGITPSKANAWGWYIQWIGAYEEPVYLESVNVPSDQPDPVYTNVVLEAGQDYLIRASGTFSVWNGKTDGLDAYYVYAEWRVGDTPQAWKQLLLDDKPMYDIAGENNDPVSYNEYHIYQTKLTGTGETLKLQIGDAKTGSWPDNHGFLTVELFKL